MTATLAILATISAGCIGWGECRFFLWNLITVAM
jgi:hypothetical protein